MVGFIVVYSCFVLLQIIFKVLVAFSDINWVIKAGRNWQIRQAG